jgi:glycine cleavage system aminomethyltransferase T
VDELPRAHVNCEAAVATLDALDASAGAHGKNLAGLEFDESLVEEERDEDAHPVAAHLRDRAVGVAVVHEPDGFWFIPEDLPAFGEVLGTDGARVGEVTSGTFSPTLRTGIALALLDASAGIAEGDKTH